MNCPVCSTKAKVSNVWKNKRHQTRVYLCPECLTEFRTREKIDYSSMDKYILEQINKQAVEKAKKQKVTKEHLKIAKENGIKESTVRSRVYYHGWDVEDAIVTPPNYGKYKKWREVAKANGIALPTFYSRINVNGWTPEKAATTPLLKRRETANESLH